LPLGTSCHERNECCSGICCSTPGSAAAVCVPDRFYCTPNRPG
jgi:hypothetical protein